jgi:hypothetical protein
MAAQKELAAILRAARESPLLGERLRNALLR